MKALHKHMVNCILENVLFSGTKSLKHNQLQHFPNHKQLYELLVMQQIHLLNPHDQIHSYHYSH